MRALRIILWAVLAAALPLAQAAAQDAPPAAGDTWTEPLTAMEFVWVPGGCYEMGCGPWTEECFDMELPVHEVCVDGFWMGRTEVTQGQWNVVMNNANPSRWDTDENLPVETLTWNRAQAFVARLMEMDGADYVFRLPTEAEWEYACRSGGREEMYSGWDDQDAVAWYDQNSGDHTHPVARQAPNGLGLFDMSGNVGEWVLDTFSFEGYAAHERDNPLYDEGQGSVRVRRGGSWDSYPRYVRCSSRDRNAPNYSSSTLGLRLMREN